MTIALLLWGYAAALTILGSCVLRKASWTDRAPRLAAGAWQVVTLSAILTVAFGGLALTMSTAPVSSNLAAWFAACALAIRDQYATPGGAVVGTAGLVAAVVVLTRWLYCVLTELASSRRTRERHHAVLAMIGRADPAYGLTLLEHDCPVVYCVAGRPHRIVVTSGASNALDPEQLVAVLAHERAHLRGRHHLVVAVATATARAFPWPHVFRDGQREVTRLVELIADDHAVRTSDRLTLAEAMLTLADGRPPTGALAVGGSASGDRIRRLIDGHRPLRTWASAGGLAAMILLITAPLLALATPAATAGSGCCGEGVHARTVAADHCHESECSDAPRR